MWQNTITRNVGTAQCEDGTIKCENGTIKCEKKNKGTTKCGKIQSYVMLVLRNVRMIPSNVRKKINEPPNVAKYSHM